MNELKVKRLQNEIMYLKEDNHLLVARVEKLQDENEQLISGLGITDWLLNEQQKLLDAIPECPVHGQCIPHALEWIEKAKQCEDELISKNFLLEKTLIDVAIAHQQINHLKKQGELQIVQIEKIKKAI